MARNLNKDVIYRSAKSKEKDYRICAGGGLFLLVKTDKTKRWVFYYRFNGKQNTLGFGIYPDNSLENARRRAEAARKQIAEGIDPGEIKRQQKASNRLTRINEDRVRYGLPILDSFADVALKWLDSIKHLTRDSTQFKKASRLKRLAFPSLGDKPIKEVKIGRAHV